MNEHLKDIFVATSCPSQQQLLDYVQGKLTPEQQHEVEMHLADCELCSEALDGLAAFNDKEKLPALVREMRWELLKKLHNKYRKSRRPEHFNIYIAVIVLAIIFLILALFWGYHFYTHPK